MKVSVITAVFNNRRYIEACIESVLSQTYRNIEHIIIDGGSTDGTLDVIKAGKRSEAIGDEQKVMPRPSPLTYRLLHVLSVNRTTAFTMLSTRA
jgi:GT2 family glycosyltransferase